MLPPLPGRRLLRPQQLRPTRLPWLLDSSVQGGEVIPEGLGEWG